MADSPFTSILAMASQMQNSPEEPAMAPQPLLEESQPQTPEEKEEHVDEMIEELREQHRLAKNPSKLYDSRALKKRHKTNTGQFKLITLQHSPIIIEFQDLKSPFETISGSHQTRPQNIKNGHVIFHKISADDKLSLSLSEHGQTTATIINKEQEEIIRLGCVFKFEFKHSDSKSLIVRQEDITDDMQVIGGLGEITFLAPKQSQETEAENLRLKHLKDEEQRQEVLAENREAISPVNWNAALKFLSKQEEQIIEIDPND